MAKPSIFSKDYEMKMKKRKNIKRVVISICVLAMVILFGLNAANAKLNKLVGDKEATIETPEEKTSINTDTNSTDVKKVEAEDKKDDIKTEVVKPVTPENTVRTYDLQITPNKIVQVYYEEKNGKQDIKDVKTTDGTSLYFDVSPGNKGLVIYDKITQNMYYTAITNNTTTNKSEDITKPNYVSTYNDVYDKNIILSSKPKYIWCDSPKFLSDTQIVYISQLPWFNSTSKYLWIYDINSKAYAQIQGIQGADLTIGNRVQTNIEVTTGGSKITIAQDLSIKN